MLVTRTFRVVDNKSTDLPCNNCPILMICYNFIDNNSGEIIASKYNQMSIVQKHDYEEIISKASYCRKGFPKYKVIETTPKQVHRLVGKGGNTILESNSFLGMIGQMILTVIISVIALAIFASIFCGIANLF